MSLRSAVVRNRSTAATINRFAKGPLAAAIAATFIAVPVHADTGIQEVVVTAQKREESLQDTPIAMSALSADTLTKMGVTDFTGVANASPSIFFAKYPSASSSLFLFIRGQGNGDPAQITGDGAVGLYHDGIYLSRPQAATFDLADVESVEILRGPQGTLYGRNTTGGAINIITRKPSGEFGFKQDISIGNRDYFRSLTTIDLPAWNDIATKLSILKSSKDGFVKNIGNSHDYSEESQLAGRFALRWNASEKFVADYAFETGDQNSTPAYYRNKGVEASGLFPGYSTPSRHTWRAIDLPESTTRFEGHALTLDWDPADDLKIRSLTSYRELTTRFFQDYAEVFFSPFTTDDLIRNYQFSQEFQFVGSALDNQIRYAAGLYYFQESGSHFEQSVSGTYVKDRFVDADSKSKAVYAQVTWAPPMLDQLELTVGGRYTEDDRDASRLQFDNFGAFDDDANTQDFKRFNPAFTANYRWNDDLSTYATVATGYRAGGSSESSTDFGETYGPEKVTNYELGLKSYWLDRRVRANAAIFRMDYDDMQIATSPDASDVTITQTINAGTATIDGFELDLLVEPIDDLRLSLDYAYLNADVDKVRVNGQDLTRAYVVPFAPLNTYNASIDYTFLHFDKGDVAAFLEYRWQDAAFVSGTSGPAVTNGDYYERPSFGLLNARLTLSIDLPRGDHATIALWSKNLTDKEYKSHVIGLGDINAGYSSQAYTLGEPRSAGIDISYRY